MTRTATRTRMIGLVAGTALASMALGGCATKVAPRADLSASKAEAALAKGKADQAVSHAEAAVLAEPRNVAYRAMLGAAYLDAGRFESAAQSFDDAMALGDNSPRTALSYALAEIGNGDNPAALSILNDWRQDIDPADMGLALALAGQPDQGTQLLIATLRAGAVTPKVRQNLASAYALQGNWAAARVMAAEDVPADQLDKRLAEWARSAQPDAFQHRVAQLLSVPVTSDPGQPVQLALANNPSSEQMVAEAAALVPAPAPAQAYAAADGMELPPLGAQPAPAPAPAPAPVVAVAETRAPAPAKFEDAFATPAPAGATFAQMAEAAMEFVSKPVVQTMPARYGAATPAPQAERRAERRVAAAAPVASRTAGAQGGKHLVQLGSFTSEQGARRAWGIYTSKYAGLDDYEMVITKAVVRGQTYYRVSAGNMASRAATSMCSKVKASGNGCIAWAEGRPLPGAVDTGVRMASR